MSRDRRIRMLLVAGTLALGPSLAGGEEPGPDVFGVQWESREIAGSVAAVQGYVENRSTQRVGDVRLRVDTLDERGAVVGESFGWVIGDVPAGGWGFFLIRVAVPGVAYRVRVESFDRMGQAP